METYARMKFSHEENTNSNGAPMIRIDIVGPNKLLDTVFVSSTVSSCFIMSTDTCMRNSLSETWKLDDIKNICISCVDRHPILMSLFTISMTSLLKSSYIKNILGKLCNIGNTDYATTELSNNENNMVINKFIEDTINWIVSV
jgi:hypothetical protein